MSNEIIKVIDALCDKLGVAVDWSAENVLPQVQYLIERYANYLMVCHVFGVLLGVILLIIFSLCAWILFNKSKNNNDPFEIVSGWIAAFSATISLIFGIGCSIDNTLGLIKILTIPEIYTIQKLLEMIQNM